MCAERSYTVSTTTLIHNPQFKEEVEEQKTENVRVVKLKNKPKKEVKWAEDTVDNENMNKLKSNGIIILFFQA